MKKGLWIYLLILVLIASAFDFLVLRTYNYTPDKTQTFSVNPSRYILIRSNNEADVVAVTTASDGYYRVKAGDMITEGQRITGNYFQNKTQLPVGKWTVEVNSGNVSFTVVSESLFVVTTKATTFLFIVIIIDTLVLGAMFFLAGGAIASR